MVRGAELGERRRTARRARHVIVFARTPEYGRVKTRLARETGPLSALRFHKTTAERLLRRLEADPSWTVWLAWTGQKRRAWPGKHRHLRQGSGSIAERMERCLRAMPPGDAVLLGADIPGVTAQHLRKAFEGLKEGRLVFGPAGDGGFWLVGARLPSALPRPLFPPDVRWSADETLGDVLRGIRLTYSLVDTMDDVDCAADLARAKAEGQAVTVIERPPVIVVAGPTASGKSALALRLAQELGGVIVNADSMQVYRDLRILTARPSAADEQAAPHRLYGHVDAADRYSAGRWLTEAVAAIEAAYLEGRRPIVAGGTGFYVESLTKGLSPIPEVPAAVLTAVAVRIDAEGRDWLFHAVSAMDPATAARVGAGDRQRLARALAVYEATGRPISYWQSLPPPPPSFAFDLHWLNPSRPALYARCDRRLAAMMDEGALEGVGRLSARRLAPDLPAMKALGMADLRAYLEGNLDKAAALAAAQQATRRFAKRQLTWFRNRLGNASRHDEQFSESLLLKILRKLQNMG